VNSKSGGQIGIARELKMVIALNNLFDSRLAMMIEECRTQAEEGNERSSDHA
jgi:hypothetical protein